MAVEVSVISGPDVRYPEAKLLIQLFSIKNNFSIHALWQELLILALSCSPFYIIYNKTDNNYKDLTPIRHKEFNEFIKGKGFKGRNNYKLRDLKAMFGFKPMITGSPVMISSNELEPTRFDSLSKASTLQEYHMLPFYM